MLPCLIVAVSGFWSKEKQINLVQTDPEARQDTVVHETRLAIDGVFLSCYQSGSHEQRLPLFTPTVVNSLMHLNAPYRCLALTTTKGNMSLRCG